jgi:DNA-binding transcriptional MerR regulator
MFKIGDFSRFSRVSVKMLRHYDELGLLKPTQIDRQTGYRYYTADQLPRLNRIIALKDLGFTLDQIRDLLDDSLTAEQLRGMLLLKRGEAEQRLADEQARLGRIEARLRQIEREQTLPLHEVVLCHVDSRLYATIRRTVPQMAGQVEPMFDQVEAYAAQFAARAAVAPLMLCHDREYREQDLDLEVAVPLLTHIPASDAVNVRVIEGGTMACMVYTGAYKTLEVATQSIMLWIDANGYRVAGATREVYLRFGANTEHYTLPTSYLTDDPSQFVTELQIPVMKE